MKQEEQTCTKNSPIYINASWLLVANDKIKATNFSTPFQHSFLLHIEIMDILNNDESSCFLK
jgi:hypothetical protein